MNDGLTPPEQAAVHDAIETGYLVASGRRLQVLRQWRAHCRRHNRPCVEIRLGKRHARVLVDEKKVWQGARAEAEGGVAQQYARPQLQS